MTYAIRNSIIIFGLMILVLFFNVFTKNKTSKQLDSINLIYQNKLNELNSLKRMNPDLEKEKEIIAQHDDMQLRALNRTKFLLKYDDPTQSYKYLSSLSERYSPNLKFDFRYDSSGTLSGTQYNKYTLSGKTELDYLYRFIYQLERQSPLVKIAEVQLEEKEEQESASGKKLTAKTRVLNFSVKVLTFFDESGRTYEEMAITNLPHVPLKANPFRAKIFEPEIDESEMHLMNIEHARIIGMSEETITMKDDAKRISILKVGDRVVHGSLERIDLENEYAVFKTKATGVMMDVKLYLERE